MPWRETGPMEERVRFVVAHESNLYDMSELCELHSISRKTGYKWLRRFEEGGFNGLADLSRAPLSCPHRMPVDVAEALIGCRRAHPTWGPRKLVCYLDKHNSKVADRLPAISTAGDLLKGAGLVQPRRRRVRAVHPGSRPLVAHEPNDVWCIDFKGEFKTQDGVLCYPLTVTDAASRYLLSCTALPSTNHAGAQDVLTKLFAHAGLPSAIRSDNGCPFCSNALCGISRLSMWWMKLGIRHDRIRPASPQENGRHERMHRTLKAETARPPAEDRRRQQERFDAFGDEYNHIRPHEALAMQTPDTIWTPSTRAMPQQLAEPEYPGHMQVRTVRNKGEIKFAGRLVFVSEVLAHQRVALEEVEDGIWSLIFYNMLLARLDQRTMKLIPAKPKIPAEVLPMFPV